MLIFSLMLIASYLLGAIPTAVIAGKILRGIDIRDFGSGNAGATNTWRVLGWKAGVVVLALDACKGAAAATVIPLLSSGQMPVDQTTIPVICGIAAVIGHVFPVYTGFRGGKGVATGAGMLFAIAPIPMGIALGVFGLVVTITGHVSAGSLLGGISVPISILLIDCFSSAHYNPLILGLTSALALFIIFTHRKNIIEIIRGRERSFPQAKIWKRLLHR